VPNFERRFQTAITVNFSDLKQFDTAKGLYFNLQKVLTQYPKPFLRKKHFSAKNAHFIFLPWLKSALYGPGTIFMSRPSIFVVPITTLCVETDISKTYGLTLYHHCSKKFQISIYHF